MNQRLCSVEEARGLIERGGALLLAGEERLLGQLPRGNWIGGTIPYFIDREGGVFCQERVFVTELPAFAKVFAVKVYDGAALSAVYSDGPERGFSFVIIPGMSEVHFSFALEAPRYPGFATKPLVGWIAGVDLARLGQQPPRVVDGTTGAIHDDRAVVMHVALPADKTADVGIINIFEQGDGDALRFVESGFAAADVIVRGERRDLVGYLGERKLDTKLPLVADYGGALINTSVQKVDGERRQVTFYAPVFEGVEYRWAAPMEDYIGAFTTNVPSSLDGQVVFSCNCILNYLYSELEGKRTGEFVGPITFGEIAYQLVNQTLVYLQIIEL